jgi:hypothetical protein
MSVVRQWDLSDHQPRSYEDYFDSVDPPVSWELTREMVVGNDRNDYRNKITDLGDKFVDMPGSPQRSAGWGFERYIHTFSSAVASTAEGNGFTPNGFIWERSLLKLIRLKTGLIKPEELTEDTKRGIENEDPLCEEAEDRLGVKILNVPMIPHGVWVQNGILYKQSDALELVAASSDGVIIESDNPDDNRALVEFKVPRHLDRNKYCTYLQQVQLQMWCLDADYCYLIQGIPPSMNTIGKWQIMIERVTRDPLWPYQTLGHAISYTEYIRQYRIQNGITYNKFLQLIV